MLVLAVEVNHSPAMPITSRPEDSWLKKRGWPGKIKGRGHRTRSNREIAIAMVCGAAAQGHVPFKGLALPASLYNTILT